MDCTTAPSALLWCQAYIQFWGCWAVLSFSWYPIYCFWLVKLVIFYSISSSFLVKKMYNFLWFLAPRYFSSSCVILWKISTNFFFCYWIFLDIFSVAFQLALLSVIVIFSAVEIFVGRVAKLTFKYLLLNLIKYAAFILW